MKVAIISDIHANIFALNSVYSDIEKSGIDYILVSGDLIGYYYWPKDVISLLKNDSRVICIAGNHEANLKKVIKSKTDADYYRKKYGSGYDVCLETLSEEDLDWLLNLPESIEIELGDCSFHLGHGSLNSVDEYLYPDADIDKFLDNYSSKKVTVFGHTHYPFIHSKDDKFLLNPGSVGQPRDIGGSACYAILDLGNMVFSFKRKQFFLDQIIETAKKIDPELEYLWKIMSR